MRLHISEEEITGLFPGVTIEDPTGGDDMFEDDGKGAVIAMSLADALAFHQAISLKLIADALSAVTALAQKWQDEYERAEPAPADRG